MSYKLDDVLTPIQINGETLLVPDPYGYILDDLGDGTMMVTARHTDLVFIVDIVDIPKILSYKWRLVKRKGEIQCILGGETYKLCNTILGCNQEAEAVQINEDLYDFTRDNLRIAPGKNSTEVTTLMVPHMHDKTTIYEVFVDREDVVKKNLDSYNWIINSDGYCVTSRYDYSKKKSVWLYLHKLIAGDLYTTRFRFKNKDRLDCRRCNIKVESIMASTPASKPKKDSIKRLPPESLEQHEASDVSVEDIREGSTGKIISTLVSFNMCGRRVTMEHADYEAFELDRPEVCARFSYLDGEIIRRSDGASLQTILGNSAYLVIN